jgi:hypothetical protein
MTATLLRVAEDGLRLGIWTDYDKNVIIYLIKVLERPVLDIQGELAEQPRLRAAIGFYFRQASLLAKKHEDALAEFILRTYNSMYRVKYAGQKAPIMMKAQESMGKFTEKLVVATALEDPVYGTFTNQARESKQVADILMEVKEAFTSRGRLLEQISNNSRFGHRDDKAEGAED